MLKSNLTTAENQSSWRNGQTFNAQVRHLRRQFPSFSGNPPKTDIYFKIRTCLREAKPDSLWHTYKCTYEIGIYLHNQVDMRSREVFFSQICRQTWRLKISCINFRFVVLKILRYEKCTEHEMDNYSMENTNLLDGFIWLVLYIVEFS